MITWAHHHSADMGSVPRPPLATGLSELDVGLIWVADLTYGGAAPKVDQPCFT
jgi:hypothetical protein